MSRTTTYDEKKLPTLKKQLEAANKEFKKLGYGSKAHAARWLIDTGEQQGTAQQVSKKISHLLNGYVRGIHPTLRSGGVWRPEEAERILALLVIFLKKATPNFPKGAVSREERRRSPIKFTDNEF